FVPEWSFGRLVETPTDMTNQLAYYAAKGGVFAPARSLTTGYDFVADGATATGQKLQSLPTTLDSLITPPGAAAGTGWTHDTFLDHLLGRNGIAAPDAAAANAHYDHHRLLPAAGAPLVQSTEIPSNLLAKLIFTIGCHSGYTIADWLYAAGDPFALDWAESYAKAGAIAYVGQAGYGLGDTDVVGYSEQLQVLFASLLGRMSMGEALTYAKQQYFGSLAIVSPYDQKVLNEATFYGLPMWHIGNGTPPAPPLPASTSVDQATGLTSVAIDAENPTFTAVHTNDGDYFTTASGGFAVENRRPVEPSTTFDVTQ